MTGGLERKWVSELTGTLKVITPLPEIKSDGSKFTDGRVREVPTETPSSSSARSETNEFVLDYKEKNGRPFIADLLNSRFLYDQKITQSDMDTVDEWVTFEITRRGLNGKTESYREVVDDLSKKLKLPKTIAPQEKVKRMAILLKKAVEMQKTYSKLGIDLKSLEEIYGDTI